MALSRLTTVLSVVREKLEQLEAIEEPTPAELDLKCELIAAIADMEAKQNEHGEAEPVN